VTPPLEEPLEPEFLTLDEVLDIHNDQIRRELDAVGGPPSLPHPTTQRGVERA
jgi:hypothetical protein